MCLHVQRNLNALTVTQAQDRAETQTGQMGKGIYMGHIKAHVRGQVCGVT